MTASAATAPSSSEAEHPSLPRPLLSWLKARGNHRLVAVLLELEAAYDDSLEMMEQRSVVVEPHSSDNNASAADAFLARKIEELLADVEIALGIGAKEALSAVTRITTQKRWQKACPLKLRDIEAEVVAAVLSANDGNRSRTASHLGVSVRHIEYRMKTLRSRSTAADRRKTSNAKETAAAQARRLV